MSKLFSDELKLTARDALGGLYPAAVGEEPGGLPLRKLIAALFRSRYLVIGTTLFGILIGAFLAITTPNSYVSVGKFISFGQGAEQISVDPTRVTQASQEVIGSSATYVMLSEEVLKRVIARLTPAKILSPYQPEAEAGGMQSFFHQVQRDWNSDAANASFEDALKYLKKTISVERPRFTELLICSATANNKKLAQEICQTFMEEAQKHHLEIYDDPKVFEGVVQRYNTAVTARQAAHKAMRDFLEREAQVEDFDFQLKHLQAAAREAADKAYEAEIDIKNTTSMIAAQADLLKSMSPTRQGFRKPLTTNLTAGIDQIIDRKESEVARLRALGSVGPSSGLEETIKEIAELRRLRAARITEAQNAPDEPFVEPDPNYRQVEESLVDDKTRLERMKSVVEDYRREATRVRTALRALQDIEPKYVSLRDALAKADDDVKSGDQALNAANTRKQLRLGNFSALRETEKASYPLEKEGPNRSKLILGGLFVGLFLGMGIIIMRTLPDNVVRTREDLENVDGIAVIGIMPRLENRNLKRHRVLREQGW